MSLEEQQRAQNTPEYATGIPDQVMKLFERQEQVINRLDSAISILTKDVSALTANVGTLTRNQESLFSKTSRPFQWSAFIAALGLVAVGAGLLISPRDKELDRLHEFSLSVMMRIERDAHDMGRMEADLEWLKKLEERVNDRTHQRLEGGVR
jgi:hypothetical protein